MKHLQTFKMFESTSSLTREQIQFLDNCTIGSWSQDPVTGEINVEGSFIIPDNYTRDFKGLRFGKVTGYFDCSGNYLTSFKGAPEVIKGEFYSDGFYFPPGQWGPLTFLQVLLGGSEKQKQMILPLVDPKMIQERIDKNPEKMAIELKPFMNNLEFQKLGLKWPAHLQSEIDLLGDLEGIGL